MDGSNHGHNFLCFKHSNNFFWRLVASFLFYKMATRVSAVLRTGNVSCVTQEVTCVVLVTVASTNIIIFILSFFSGAAPSGEEGDMEISGRNSTSGLGGLTTLVGGANGGSSNLGEGGDMEISGGSSTSGLGGLTTLVGDAGGGSSTSSLGGFGGTAAEAPFVSSTVDHGCILILESALRISQPVQDIQKTI